MRFKEPYALNNVATKVAPFESLQVADTVEVSINTFNILKSMDIITDFYRNKILAHYRKVHLWDNEKNIFLAGDDLPPIIETKYGRLSVMICYDLEFPEWVRISALNGADI